MALSGNGNGIDFNSKIENQSSYTQTINIPLSGAKNGASTIELNPVNGDLVINGPVYNDNSKTFKVYGDNSKTLTINGTLYGSVGLDIEQYSKVKITSNQTNVTGYYVKEGELLIDGDYLKSGAVLQVGRGSGSDIAKIYISDTNGGTSISQNLTVVAGSTGALAVGGLATSGTNTFTGTLSVNNSVFLENHGAGTIAFTGVVSGSGAVNIGGNGTVSLSGANTYTGNTTINSGTLKAASATGLSSASAFSVAAGAILDLNGFNSTISSLSTATGTITDSSSAGNGGTLRIATAMPATASAQLFTGSMGLQLFGGSTVSSILTNTSNTYSGGTIFGNGTGTTNSRLFVSGTIGSGTPGALTSGIYGTGAITIGASTTDRVQFYFAAATTINNNLVVNSSSGNAPTEIGAFRAESSGNVIAGSINANLADAMFNAINAGGRTISVTGQILGNSGVTVTTSGAGGLEVTLNNAGTANSYAGNTTISTANSTLTLGRADQISNGAGKGNLTITSGTFKMAGFSETINGLSGNGTVDGVSGTPTLTIGDNNATSTFTGVVKNTAGSLALTKIGTGTLTLSGNNTYGGATTISGGTLEIGAAGLLGGGTYAANIANSGAFLYSGTNNQVLSGQLSGVGTLTKNGTGILTLSGANSFNGSTTINAGTLKVGSSTGLGNGTALTVTGGVLDLNGFNATVASLGAGNAAGTITNLDAGSGTNILTVGNLTVNLASLITDGATAKTGLVFYNNTSIPWLSNANNTFSGGVTIANAGTATRMYQLGAVTSTLAGNGTLLKSNFGTGNILIGANGSTAVAQFALTTASTEIYNRIIFNAASTFADGGKAAFRADASGINLYGTLTAGASDISFSTAGTGAVTAFGQLTGTNGLTLKSSNITLTLTNNSLVTPNDYSGSTTIETSGTLVLGAANQISNGAGKGNVSNNGTFNMGGFSETINGLSGNGTIDGVSGTPTLTVGDNNATSTFTGVIKNTSGTLALAKTGAGTLTLSGNNTYSGATTVSVGTLEIGAAGRLGGGSYAANIANSGTFLYSGTNAQTLSGEISGAGALTKNGSGVLTLSGANSYTGTTTLNAGTLRIASNSALGTGTLSVNSATAVIDSAVGTSYTISNNITLATSAKIGATTTIGNLTFSGIISGSGNLVLDTLDGVTTLTGLNTFTGNVIVDRAAVDGGLSFNSIANAGVASALGAGSSISLGIGASAPFLTYTGNTAASSNRTILLAGGEAYLTANGAPLTLTGNITASAAQTLRLRGTAGGGANFNELSGAYVGGGSLSVQASTGLDVWKISGNNTFTGITYVANNAALIAGHSNAFGSTANGTQVNTNAQLLLTGNISVGAEALTLNSVAGGTWNGQTGAALRSYSGDNSWAGNITISQATTIATNSGSNFTISGGVSSTNQNLTVNSTGGTTISGTIAIGSGTLTKSGTGTLALSGANTYSGATSINAGALRASNATALGTTAAGTTVASGAALELSGGITLGAEALSLNGTGISSGGALRNISGDNTYGGAITLAAATRINSDAGTLILNGSIGGAGQNLTIGGSGNTTVSVDIGTTTGTLTKDGAGTLILLANNTYSGATTISLGTLQIGAGGASGNISSTSIVNNSALVVDRTGSITLGGNMSGSGTLAKNGSGTLVLSGSNTYSGATTLNAGTLTLQASNALGTSSLTQASGSSLLVFDTTGTVSNTLSVYNVQASQSASLSGAITVNNASFDVDSGDTLTLSGAVGGSGGVTKNGTGTLVLSGSNTYSGATVVNAGSLHAAHANALGTNASVTVNGGSLLVSTDDAINSKNLILASTASGNGTAASLVFSGTYNGTAGSLTLNQNSIIDLGTGSVVLHFTDLVLGLSNTLAIYNWTGTTLWAGGDGNNTDQFYIDRTLDAGELNRISFYSGIASSSFVGTAYQLSSGSFNREIIPVPEPETYATALALFLGSALCFWRHAKNAKKHISQA